MPPLPVSPAHAGPADPSPPLPHRGDLVAPALIVVTASPASRPSPPPLGITEPRHPNDLPLDLFLMLQSMSGFNSANVSYYFHYLVANPHIVRAFYALPWENKLDWVSMYIAEKFSGQ